MRKLSRKERAKLAVLITSAALFVPIAAQAGVPTTVTSSSNISATVAFGLASCTPLDESHDTSVAASSVTLYTDTASAAANSDAATYIYFTESNTAAWGATYSYGSSQNLATCDPENLTGTVTITRGRFISSSAIHSETTTNTIDFIQYIGNTKITGVNSGAYKGNACGNVNYPGRNANVTQSCSSGILADFSQLTQSGSVAWRDGSQRTGVAGSQDGIAYIAVKVRKGAIATAPTGTGFAATETFTVTSV